DIIYERAQRSQFLKRGILPAHRVGSEFATMICLEGCEVRMNTLMVNAKLARFYESTIGKKAVMAVTGLILFGFLIAHMLGNLQIFLGPAIMNHYAETLHGNPPLLWTVRTILLISVLLPIWASVSLSAVKK